MVFKSEQEKALALLDLPESPGGRVDDLEAWYEDIENKRKEIEEATIEAGSAEVVEGEAPQEPPPATEEPTEQPDEVLNFAFKRSDLPDELKGYKDPDEIVKQYAHARQYANKAEEKLEQLDTIASENQKLKEQLEEIRKKLEERKEAPPAKATVMDEIDDAGKRLFDMDDSDIIEAGMLKKVLNTYSAQVKDAREVALNYAEKYDQIKNDLDTKFSKIENLEKEDTQKKQVDALTTSLKDLQEKFPELKTSKPVIGGSDNVQNDVYKFAKKVLGGLYGNTSPEWAHVTAFANAYLRGDQQIKSYCDANAITPESIGSSVDDIRNYAIIHNVDNRCRGLKVNHDGTVEKLKNPFTGQQVAYANHVQAFKTLKDENGLTEKEIRAQIAEAEKRGQKRMAAALQKRATEPITLGGAGEGATDDAGQTMTEAQAKAILEDYSLESKMVQQALMGNRSIFHKMNEALKRLKQDPLDADPSWTPEAK